MVTLYLLAVIAAQAPLPPAQPALKTCPDGSVLRATDTCMGMPDHRYLMTHEPETHVHTSEWWCRGDKRPSLARFRIRQHQHRHASGRSIAPTRTIELVTLKVKGKPPSASTIRLVREKLAPLDYVGDLQGRCLNRRGSGIQSVLTMRGYQAGRRDPHNLEVELE